MSTNTCFRLLIHAFSFLLYQFLQQLIGLFSEQLIAMNNCPPLIKIPFDFFPKFSFSVRYARRGIRLRRRGEKSVFKATEEKSSYQKRQQRSNFSQIFEEPYFRSLLDRSNIIFSGYNNFPGYPYYHFECRLQNKPYFSKNVFNKGDVLILKTFITELESLEFLYELS